MGLRKASGRLDERAHHFRGNRMRENLEEAIFNPKITSVERRAVVIFGRFFLHLLSLILLAPCRVP